MGALARESKLRNIISEAFNAFKVMLNSQYDETEENIEKAIASTIESNPELAGELNNFKQVNDVLNKVLEEKANGIGEISDEKKANNLEHVRVDTQNMPTNKKDNNIENKDIEKDEKIKE